VSRNFGSGPSLDEYGATTAETPSIIKQAPIERCMITGGEVPIREPQPDAPQDGRYAAGRSTQEATDCAGSALGANGFDR
jgi:hypothetical protein